MAPQRKLNIATWIGTAVVVGGLLVTIGRVYAVVQTNTQAIQQNTLAIQRNAMAIQQLEIRGAACAADFKHMEAQISEMHADIKALLQRVPR